MDITNFTYIKREDFTPDDADSISKDAIGVFLYKVRNSGPYWIELQRRGFVVYDGHQSKTYYTLEDAYKAMCIFIVENI